MLYRYIFYYTCNILLYIMRPCCALLHYIIFNEHNQMNITRIYIYICIHIIIILLLCKIYCIHLKTVIIFKSRFILIFFFIIYLRLIMNLICILFKNHSSQHTQ